MPRRLKLDWLRTLVFVSEFGSITKAARRLGRPERSLGSHMRRLEDEIGVALYEGRRRDAAFTEAGQLLVDYGRRMLEMHDDALEAVLALNLQGAVRLGIAQDIEARVTPLLARFARLHAGIRIETRAASSRRLIEEVERGELELALAFTETSGGTLLFESELIWIGTPDVDPRREEPLRLALSEPPCVFRDVALFTLDQAAIPWRIVFTGPSLSSLWTAVSAGLGVTVRTAAAMPGGLVPVRAMPPLPLVRLMLYGASGDLSQATKRLRDWLLKHFVGDTALAAPRQAP